MERRSKRKRNEEVERTVEDVVAAPVVVPDAVRVVASQSRPGDASGVYRRASDARRGAADVAAVGNDARLDAPFAQVDPEAAAEPLDRGRLGGAPDAFRRPMNTVELNNFLDRMFRVVSQHHVWDGTPTQRKVAWTLAMDVLKSTNNSNQKWIHYFRNLRRWESLRDMVRSCFHSYLFHDDTNLLTGTSVVLNEKVLALVNAEYEKMVGVQNLKKLEKNRRAQLRMDGEVSEATLFRDYSRNAGSHDFSIAGSQEGEEERLEIDEEAEREEEEEDEENDSYGESSSHLAPSSRVEDVPYSASRDASAPPLRGRRPQARLPRTPLFSSNANHSPTLVHSSPVDSSPSPDGAQHWTKNVNGIFELMRLSLENNRRAERERLEDARRAERERLEDARRIQLEIREDRQMMAKALETLAAAFSKK